MASEDHPGSDEQHVSFSRWQASTIEQLGYALNLILTLSVAALGYELALVLDDKVGRSEWQKYLIALSTLSLTLSVAAGLFCVINRLRDFRATAQTARRREQGASELELTPLRRLTSSLGQRTWILLWWQISAFGIGILLLIVAIGGTFARTLIGESP